MLNEVSEYRPDTSNCDSANFLSRQIPMRLFLHSLQAVIVIGQCIYSLMDGRSVILYQSSLPFEVVGMSTQ